MAISKKITPPFDYWQNFDVHSQQSTFDHNRRLPSPQFTRINSFTGATSPPSGLLTGGHAHEILVGPLCRNPTASPHDFIGSSSWPLHREKGPNSQQPQPRDATRDSFTQGIQRLMDRFDRLDARLADMDHRVDSFAFPEPPEPDPPYDLDCDTDDDFRAYRRRSRGDKEHAASVFNFNRGEDSRLRRGGFLGQPQRPCGRDVGRDSPRQQPRGARFPQVRQQPTSSWDCTAAHNTTDAERTYRGVFYYPPDRTTGREFPRQQPPVVRFTPQQPQQMTSGWARPTARSHSGRGDFHQQQRSSWNRPIDRASTNVEQDHRRSLARDFSPQEHHAARIPHPRQRHVTSWDQQPYSHHYSCWDQPSYVPPPKSFLTRQVDSHRCILGGGRGGEIWE